MTTLLALDPSQETCGVALFKNSRLIAADIVRYPYADTYRGFSAESFMRIAWAVRDWSGLQPESVVFELPQHYRGSKSKAPVDDLLPLAVIGGMVCGLLGKHVVPSFVRPSEWGASGKPKKKGDPYAVEVKVRARLDADELMRLGPCPKSLSHNMFDAVAIGLYAIGRGIAAERKRVIAR